MPHYLRYLDEFDNYGIEKSAIKDLQEIRLNPIDAEKLAQGEKAHTSVAFLMGQDKATDGTEFYTVEKSYLTTALKAGADLQFLGYDNPAAQMQECSALILPGGSFASPQTFYHHIGEDIPGKRAYAYVQCIMAAEAANKPILGICAGAQMVGGMHGMKMHQSIKEETSSPIEHKTKEKSAHEILILKNSPLQKIMGVDQLETTVNSRHVESMIESPLQQYFAKTDMDIYAVSKKDNIPEAWGNEKKNILCIQWHPENLAADNPAMQNIFNWLVTKGAEVKLQKEKKLKMPINLLKDLKTR